MIFGLPQDRKTDSNKHLSPGSYCISSHLKINESSQWQVGKGLFSTYVNNAIIVCSIMVLSRIYYDVVFDFYSIVMDCL